MMDTAQLVLLIVVVVLTILLIVLGIQVFFILRELRKTVQKANKVLDDTGSIADSIAGPISSLSSLTTGLQATSFIAAAKILKGIFFQGKSKRRHVEEEG